MIFSALTKFDQGTYQDKYSREYQLSNRWQDSLLTANKNVSSNKSRNNFDRLGRSNSRTDHSLKIELVSSRSFSMFWWRFLTGNLILVNCIGASRFGKPIHGVVIEIEVRKREGLSYEQICMKC